MLASSGGKEYPMSIRHHAEITLGALRHWLVAQLYDCLIVAAMWLAILLVLHVPFAVVWALLGGLLQFIPGIGMVVALIGPVLSLLFVQAPMQRLLELLCAFAALAVVEGLILQPYLLRRKTRIPFWVSLLVPIAMGVIIPFWGVLLAPPLLAVLWAYLGRKPRPQPVPARRGVILPPERPTGADSERGNEDPSK